MRTNEKRALGATRARSDRIKLWTLIVGSTMALNALADSCGASYSFHMSKTSDLGSDMKNGSVECSLDSGDYEAGFQALTPPNGTWARTPVYVAGKPQTTSGKPSTLKDTFAVYFGYSLDKRDVRYNVKVGTVNDGFALNVRSAIDAEHRWEGVDDSRHSPLSSSARPLIQAGAATFATVAEFGSLKFTVPAAGVVGTTLNAAQVGILAHWQSPTSRPHRPRMLEIPAQGIEGSDLYLGVMGRATAYDVSTDYVGSKPVFAQIVAGYVMSHGDWGMEFSLSKDLTDRIEGQTERAYPYMSLGVRRAFR